MLVLGIGFAFQQLPVGSSAVFGLGPIGAHLLFLCARAFLLSCVVCVQNQTQASRTNTPTLDFVAVYPAKSGFVVFAVWAF